MSRAEGARCVCRVGFSLLSLKCRENLMRGAKIKRITREGQRIPIIAPGRDLKVQTDDAPHIVDEPIDLCTFVIEL